MGISTHLVHREARMYNLCMEVGKMELVRTVIIYLCGAAALVLMLHYLIMYLNYRRNARVEDGKKARLLNDQNGRTGQLYRFGIRKASGVACEAIAVHNARLLMGMESSLADVIKETQKKFAPMFFGVFGTDPFALGRVLRGMGFEPERVEKNGLDKDGTYILSFWNDRRKIKGLHTVCMLREGEKAVTFNLRGNGTVSLIPPEKYAEHYICGWYIGVNKMKYAVPSVPMSALTDEKKDEKW